MSSRVEGLPFLECAIFLVKFFCSVDFVFTIQSHPPQLNKLHSYIVVDFEQADLSKPETVPATLVGIHTVIDCATGRPEEPIKTVSFMFRILLFSFFV